MAICKRVCTFRVAGQLGAALASLMIAGTNVALGQNAGCVEYNTQWASYPNPINASDYIHNTVNGGWVAGDKLTMTGNPTIEEIEGNTYFRDVTTTPTFMHPMVL
jgi:hypothetical protein